MVASATITAPETLDLVLGFFKLNVDDLEKLTTFYQDAFGFVVQYVIKMPTLEERILSLPGQTFTLVLLNRPGEGAISVGTGHGPIGLHTTDVAAAAANIVACGGTIEFGPVTFPGATIVMALDPEGHQIELLCKDGSEVELPENIGNSPPA